MVTAGHAVVFKEQPVIGLPRKLPKFEELYDKNNQEMLKNKLIPQAKINTIDFKGTILIFDNVIRTSLGIFEMC